MNAVIATRKYADIQAETSLWMNPAVAAYVIPKLIAVQVPFTVDYAISGAAIIYVNDRHVATVARARDQVEAARATGQERRRPF